MQLVWGSVVKNPPADAGDLGLMPGSGRSPGEGNENPLQCSCLGHSRVRGAWRTKRQKQHVHGAMNVEKRPAGHQVCWPTLTRTIQRVVAQTPALHLLMTTSRELRPILLGLLGLCPSRQLEGPRWC